MLFRGYRVGSVETSTFDAQKRTISYQLFINAPNDRLVTSNVAFLERQRDRGGSDVGRDARGNGISSANAV